MLLGLTLANVFNRSSSSFTSQKDESKVRICLDGGVVMSKNLVSNVRKEQAGRRSCGSQVFDKPV